MYKGGVQSPVHALDEPVLHELENQGYKKKHIISSYGESFSSNM